MLTGLLGVVVISGLIGGLLLFLLLFLVFFPHAFFKVIADFILSTVEFPDALSDPLHQLGNLTASEKEQYPEEDQQPFGSAWQTK